MYKKHVKKTNLLFVFVWVPGIYRPCIMLTTACLNRGLHWCVVYWSIVVIVIISSWVNSKHIDTSLPLSLSHTHTQTCRYTVHLLAKQLCKHQHESIWLFNISAIVTRWRCAGAGLHPTCSVTRNGLILVIHQLLNITGCLQTPEAKLNYGKMCIKWCTGYLEFSFRCMLMVQVLKWKS